jgi:hypothetical protein
MEQTEGPSPPARKKIPQQAQNGFQAAWKKTWSDPKFIAGVITVAITGLITGATAIFVAFIQHKPAAPGAPPTTSISSESPPIIQSCLNDFYDPVYTPVYDVTTGLGLTISPTRPFTLPFTLRFNSQSRPIGGIKLLYLANEDRFEIIDNINASCISILADGKQHYLKNRDEYLFAYGDEKYSLIIQYNPVTDQLDVKLVLDS